MVAHIVRDLLVHYNASLADALGRWITSGVGNGYMGGLAENFGGGAFYAPGDRADLGQLRLAEHGLAGCAIAINPLDRMDPLSR